MEKTMFAIQNATSEGERDVISSRTYEALMVKARAGYNAGATCFGYDNVPVLEGSVKKRTEYRINDEQADVIRKIFTMFAEGDGYRTIAKTLNREGIPSPRPASAVRGPGR